MSATRNPEDHRQKARGIYFSLSVSRWPRHARPRQKHWTRIELKVSSSNSLVFPNDHRLRLLIP